MKNKRITEAFSIVLLTDRMGSSDGFDPRPHLALAMNLRSGYALFRNASLVRFVGGSQGFLLRSFYLLDWLLVSLITD